jgi:hypothetical protein
MESSVTHVTRPDEFQDLVRCVGTLQPCLSALCWNATTVFERAVLERYNRV